MLKKFILFFILIFSSYFIIGSWGLWEIPYQKFVPLDSTYQLNDSIGIIFFKNPDSLFYYYDKTGLHPFGSSSGGTTLTDTSQFAYQSDTANFAWFADSANYADTAGYALSCAQFDSFTSDDFLLSYRLDTFAALVTDTVYGTGTDISHTYMLFDKNPVSHITLYNYNKRTSLFSTTITISQSQFSPSGFDFTKEDTTNGVITNRYSYNFDYGGVYMNWFDYENGKTYVAYYRPDSMYNRVIRDSVLYSSEFIKLLGTDSDTSTYALLTDKLWRLADVDTYINSFINDTIVYGDTLLMDITDGIYYTKTKDGVLQSTLYMSAYGVDVYNDEHEGYYGAGEAYVPFLGVDEISTYDEDTITVDNYMDAHVRVADTALYVSGVEANITKDTISIYAPSGNVLYYDTNSSVFGSLLNAGVSKVPSYIYAIQNITVSEFSSGDTIGIIRYNLSEYLSSGDTLSNILSDTICLLEEIPNYDGNQLDFEHRWIINLVWFNGVSDSIIYSDTTADYGGEIYTQDTILYNASLVASSSLPNIEYQSDNQALFVDYILIWVGQVATTTTHAFGALRFYLK